MRAPWLLLPWMASASMPSRLELLGEAIRAVLGAREDEHLLPVVRLDEVREQGALAVVSHRVRDLVDELRGRVAPRHFDRHRIVHERAGQRANLLREGGGEQQVLPLLRQELDDPADVVDEAHVEHAIGLVQHQDFHAAQVHGALLHVVEQAARRRDEDVHAALERVNLRMDADAAENDGGAHRRVLAIGAHAFLHLRSELARRHEDEHADVPLRRAQALQDRQGEAGGLAGAGLRGGEQVAAGEHDGNGLRLDRRGDGVALLGDSAEQLGLEAE